MPVAAATLRQRKDLMHLIPIDDSAIGQAGQELREKNNSAALRQLRESLFRRKNVLMNARVRALSQLQPNWDGYGAPVPNRVAVDTMLRIIGLLQPYDVGSARIVPSAEGGLAICFVRGDRYADIECLNDGEIIGVRYVGREMPTLIHIEPTDASIAAGLEQVRNHVSG
jgi:hypothetical protein